MGRVYLARDTRLNRRVALKILSPERMNNPRAIARFQREARVGAQLQHENLVRIYDLGESNGRCYLVMEYIEGKTIGALIAEQGPMPAGRPPPGWPGRSRWGWSTRSRKGLIHRDVNPYNILVTHDGIAKLADLGLAIDLAEEDRVTREGATVGTFDYVSPEQARHSHSVDIRSDIYSLGCTLYHMIAGQVPFPSPSLPEKLFAHQAIEPEAAGPAGPGRPRGAGRGRPADDAEAPRGALRHARSRWPRRSSRSSRTMPGCARASPSPWSSTRAGEPSPRRSPARRGRGPGHSPAAPGPGIARSTPRARPMAASGLRGDRPGVATPGSGLGANRPAIIAPSILTPVNGDELAEAEDIPLILDLGPEPALTDSLTRARSWFGGERPAKVPGTADFPPGESEPSYVLSRGPGLLLDRPWSWGIAALLAALTLLLVAYVLTRWFASAATQACRRGPPPPRRPQDGRGEGRNRRSWSSRRRRGEAGPGPVPRRWTWPSAPGDRSSCATRSLAIVRRRQRPILCSPTDG